MRDPFKTFVIVSLIVTLGLTGWSFAKSQSQGDHLARSVNVQHTLVVQQGQDREAAILKNVEARKLDCDNTNQLRAGLREQVVQGQKQLPLILRLLPSLNTKEVLALNHKEVRRELKAYAPINCTAYSERALPPVEKVKVTLAEQQRQLRNIVIESAHARVTTVGQRCKLTLLIDQTLSKFVSPKAPEVKEFAKSYAACAHQLQEVERIAKSAGTK